MQFSIPEVRETLEILITDLVKFEYFWSHNLDISIEKNGNRGLILAITY